ncbi:hypothetical protein BASA83_003969 [Batrachochytrium salamandrivorans]|nr:hypothetical protein BASA83_003969 [Batrachochytrium salamandrivorans]
MERQRASKVKNKNAAAVQITAEQLLKEAESTREKPAVQPKQRVADKEELDDYRMGKRKSFEDAVRRNRTAVGAWLKYASWEESQDELERARSVFERSLDFEPRNQTLWLKYAEMEMKHRNVNRARNVLDRVVAILPRVDLFWYKYTYMEELLDNAAGARQVFERWMEWEPSEEAWMAFVKFEKRYNEHDRARRIFQRFVQLLPQPKNWIKWSKFEEVGGNIDMAREIYEQCMSTLGDAFIDQNMYISFAKFETRLKEIERARVIFKFALEKLPEGQKENLYNAYTQFEKQYGGKDSIEEVVISKRRIKYEDGLAETPHNYDIWFDYARLEESTDRPEKIREVYERAIAQLPPIAEKRYWRRYIYLWLFYAVWEETVGKDIERARQVYTNCLKVIPHKKFTFSKVWIMYSHFLVRQMDISQARKVLGQAIGMCPKERLFKGYIELELELREFDRVRILYQKYLEWNSANCYGWIKFSELESILGDVDRARAIFEIAVSQPALDMPEVLWKSFIDFEIKEAEWSNARELYSRLLQLTDHVKVHISFANFEMSASESDDIQDCVARARARFTSSANHLRKTSTKEERVLLLEAWRDFERQHGTAETLKSVQAKLPRPVKKRRRIEDEQGAPAGEDDSDEDEDEDDDDEDKVENKEGDDNDKKGRHDSDSGGSDLDDPDQETDTKDDARSDQSDDPPTADGE